MEKGHHCSRRKCRFCVNVEWLIDALVTINLPSEKSKHLSVTVGLILNS